LETIRRISRRKGKWKEVSGKRLMFLKGSGEGDRAIGKSGLDPFTIHSATSRRIRDRLDKVQRGEHHCDTSIRCLFFCILASE